MDDSEFVSDKPHHLVPPTELQSLSHPQVDVGGPCAEPESSSKPWPMYEAEADGQGPLHRAVVLNLPDGAILETRFLML